MANRRRELAAAAGFGLLALAGLLAANAPLFNTQVYETLDIAANSLVIQDAKRLDLLTGVYSRFGFFHPGPAILYVLAAGEVVFHDVLRWVPSPVAGQVIAACFLNAMWIGMLAWLLIRAFDSTAAGVSAAAIFFAAAVLRDPQYVVNLWLPCMHFLVFAVFTAALARFASGVLDGLVPLCLAGGVLVHGHVSFVAILAIMLAGGAMAYLLAVRPFGAAAARLRVAAHEQRALLVVSALILVAFATPIALHTLLHYPGELGKYLAHKTGAGNPWDGALAYLSQFWWQGGGLMPLVAGCVAMLVLAASHATRGLAIAAGLATLAAAFFAKVAVDDLSRPFLGFFYFGVVTLVAGSTGGWVLSQIRSRQSAAAGVVLLAASLVAAAHLKPSLIWPSRLVPAITQHLLSLSPKPVVLDLDTSHEWELLWGHMAGAAADWVRRGERLACISEGWHILFTERLRCREEDLIAGSRVHVTARDLPPAHAAVAIGDLRFVSLAPWVTPLGGSVMFNALEARGRLREGWSPEQDFAWTIGPRSVLDLKVEAAGPFRLEFDVAAIVPGPAERQRVEVRVNGKGSGTFEFSPERNHAAHVIDVAAGATRPGGAVRIEFLVERPVSPASLGQSGDTRPLGMMLRSVRVLPP